MCGIQVAGETGEGSEGEQLHLRMRTLVTGPGSSVSSAGGARDRGKGQVGQIQPSEHVGSAFSCPHCPKQGNCWHISSLKVASWFQLPLIYSSILTYLKYVSSSGASGSTPNYYVAFNVKLEIPFDKDTSSEGWSLGPKLGDPTMNFL